MRLIALLLRVYFDWLYHGLAFTYDLTAWTISFGQWTNWIRAVIPFLEGTRVLELGHGPGHLQRILHSRGLFTVGLDESHQMGRLARQRLLRSGYTTVNLARGLGQTLPFRGEAFDSIVATFPAEYIFEERTASEARRVLRNGGRLIVLPVAWPKNRLLSWLFRITGEAPSQALNVVKEKISQPFVRAGFEVGVETLEVQSSVMLIVLAKKK